MRRTALLLILILALLAGCTAPDRESALSTQGTVTTEDPSVGETLPAATVSPAVTEAQTYIRSATPQPSDTATSPPPTTSTAELIPFSNDVVVSFIIGASDGMDDKSACLAAKDIYRFVLYQDGRLIKFDGFQYVETRISQAEMANFLSDIEATGFSSLRGNGDQYIENPPPPSFKDTWGGSVTVHETTITVTPGQSDYLVEPVTRVLEIMENYRPANLQPYAPESLSLWVYLEETISLGLANPTPEPPVLKWSVGEIKLNELLTDLTTSKPKVISGETLSFVMGQVKHIPVVRRVEQNNYNYLVVVCPNFA